MTVELQDVPPGADSELPSSILPGWTSRTWWRRSGVPRPPDRIYGVSGHIDSRRTILTNRNHRSPRRTTMPPASR
jgi:hypothetical protein